MCGCNTGPSRAAAEDGRDVLQLRVEDMTCGHCAAAITRAVEAGIPGAVVEADPASKMVRVRGTRDLAAVRVLIAGAGYTPSETALA